jgi:uncharacterized membrane protein YdjX (TVP38/TMEM64 family)
MRPFLQALTHLDTRPWRTIAVSFLLFGGVGVVFLLGATLLGLNTATHVERWIGAGAAGPWSPFVAVAGFTLLAFLGAPQFVLIAAAVVAFGPWPGFVDSWIGTEVSALVGFWLGRRFGARLLNQHAGRGLRQFTDLVGRNGLVASLIIRLAPGPPFIVVNMAAGVTSMRWWSFALGTGLGIIPKIAATAFFGHTVINAVSGRAKGGGWASLLLIVVVWVAIGLLARWWLKRSEAAEAAHAETAKGVGGPVGADGA